MLLIADQQETEGKTFTYYGRVLPFLVVITKKIVIGSGVRLYNRINPFITAGLYC